MKQQQQQQQEELVSVSATRAQVVHLTVCVVLETAQYCRMEQQQQQQQEGLSSEDVQIKEVRTLR
jgi:hypothetical protein